VKLHGDNSSQDKELAEQLEIFERSIDGTNTFPPECIAQMLVCLAHDWFQLKCEEEGQRLLDKADKVFPGYLTSPEIKLHMKEDDEFTMVMVNIGKELIGVLADRLKDKK
jgi:hypothetical protein